MQPDFIQASSPQSDLNIETGFKYQPLYTAEDLQGIDHLHSRPGELPFLRGPYPTMYTQRPWTIRQYAGFGDAKTTNQLYRAAISKGAKGLSIAFDLPTHRGWDSDSPHAAGDVGKAGVAIDSVEDMKTLLAGIPLNDISVSMTMNGAVLPIMASYIVAAEELGFKVAELSGTIQNDILKEFMVRNTYIFSPEVSLRIAADIVEYNAKNLPKFNSMSISGYHFQEAGADPVLELALTLSNAKTYIEYAIRQGWEINTFCEHLTFFFCVGSDFYLEIAKLRAARLIWAELLESYGVTSKKAKALRMHCQTSGWSLVAGDPLNNIARTTAQAMAAAFGGTQSLHTNSYDEAYSLPTEKSSTVARDTQRILQEETGICHVIDPWAGSYMMEKITAEVIAEVKTVFDQVDTAGGMLKALDDNLIQKLIQTRAAKTQAKIDSGKQKIVGASNTTHNTASLNVDSDEIRLQQTSKMKAMKRSRDDMKVRRALKSLSNIAQKGQGSLLSATIEAIKCRATVQECTEAIAKSFPRHQQSPIHIKDVYGNEMRDHPEWMAIELMVSETTAFLNRPPKVMIAKVGQDGHDRGANVVTSILSDVGCEVKQLPLFNSIENIVLTAAGFGADLIAISSLANAHNELVPALMHELRSKNVDIPVVLGGIVPVEDHEALKWYGVAFVMDPGVTIQKAIPSLMSIIKKKSLNKQTTY